MPLKRCQLQPIDMLTAVNHIFTYLKIARFHHCFKVYTGKQTNEIIIKPLTSSLATTLTNPLAGDIAGSAPCQSHMFTKSMFNSRVIQ